MTQTVVNCAPGAAGTLIDQLIDIVGRQLSIPISELHPETPLESLGITSVDVVAIVWEIEERFGVEIDLARVGDGVIRAIRDITALAAAVDMARGLDDPSRTDGVEPQAASV